MLAAICAALLCRPAAAQQLVPTSVLAGVNFPQPGAIWFPDPQRSQAATLNALAASIGRACAATEFVIWDVANATAGEAVLFQTRVAFTEAGWSIETIRITGGESAYLARRGAAELLMDWISREGSIGLLLCLVGEAPAEGAGGAVRPEEIRAADGTPLPRLRPDPNAPAPIAEVAAVAPPAVEPPAPAIGPAGAPTPTPAAAAIDEAPLPAANPPAGIAQVIEADIAPVTVPAGAEPPGPAPRGADTSLALLLLAAALAAAAVILVRWGLAAIGGRPAAGWPTAIAAVVYSQVASETRRDRRGREMVRFVPVIAYDYEVDQTSYRAARLRFGDAATADPDEAKAVVDRYPVGAGIEIRHHPNRPGDAVIEGASDRVDATLIAGIALAVLALASLISAVV